MREINQIIIHCADTPPEMDIGVEEIRKWHVEERGWSDIGYHFVIRKNGVIEFGRPIEIAGAHVKGHNKHSIGICYVGGANGLDDRTDEQKSYLLTLILMLQGAFPGTSIHGHNEFSSKSCPNFNANKEYESINN